MSQLRCVVPFATATRVVPNGALVDSDDPIVKGREHLFRPVPAKGAAPVVEQATAAPGEQRSTTPRKARAKKAAPKAED